MLNPNETIRKQKIYFELVTQLGNEMLANGGEIFRTSDVMQYAAAALGLEDFHAFVIANGIFASMLTDGQTYSCQVRYISLAPVNICRLEALNALSRKIVGGLDDPKKIEAELHRIHTLESSGNLLKILGSGLGSGSFCYLFGGSLYDSLTAFLVGCILYVFLLYLMPKLTLPKIMHDITASLIVASACIWLHALGFGDQLDRITIGALFPLVPGIALTTSFRNFLENDYLAGLVRLLDALVTAGGIALGVGIATVLFL
jgi:uncharacterized membrane protein YjjP (DUF1212 family)